MDRYYKMAKGQIERRTQLALDVAAENGQLLGNVGHLTWFVFKVYDRCRQDTEARRIQRRHAEPVYLENGDVANAWVNLLGLTGEGSNINVRRTVTNVKATGHTAKDWGGAEYNQYTGNILYRGQILKVWGYTPIGWPTSPSHWANDTF